MSEDRKRLLEAIRRSIWQELAQFAVQFVPEEAWGEEWVRLTDWASPVGRAARKRIEAHCTFTGMLLEADKAVDRAKQRNRQRARREGARIAFSLDDPLRHEVLSDPRAADPLDLVLANEGLADRLTAAGLTARERAVALLLAKGYAPGEIAANLGVSRAYVSKVMRALRRKL